MSFVIVVIREDEDFFVIDLVIIDLVIIDLIIDPVVMDPVVMDLVMDLVFIVGWGGSVVEIVQHDGHLRGR